MKYLAFLILFAIFLYINFIKPFLHSKGIFYSLEGFRIENGKISLKEFTLNVPLKKSINTLVLKDFSVDLKQKSISLKEGYFVSTGEPVKERERKAREIPEIYIPEFLRKINIRVDSFIISIHRNKSTVIDIKDVLLENGVLSGSVYVKREEKKLAEINVREALLKEKSIELRDAQINTEFFFARIRGYSEFRDFSFSVEGYVKPVKLKSIFIPQTNYTGSGNLNYEKLTLKLEGFSENPELLVRNRAFSLGKINFKGDIVYELRGFLSIEGDIDAPFGKTHIETIIGKEKKFLKLSSLNLFLDSDFLGIERIFLAELEGDIYIDLSSKRISSEFSVPYLYADYTVFKNIKGRFEYSLEDLYGIFAFKNECLNVKGNIRNRAVSAEVNLKDFFVMHEKFSAHLSAFLNVMSDGKFTEVKGSGTVRKAEFNGIHIRENVIYTLLLKGDKISVNLLGKSLKGKIRGNIKEKTVFAFFDFNHMSVNFRDFEIDTGTGSVEIVKSRDISLAVNLKETSLRRGNFLLTSSVKFIIESLKDKRGTLELKEITLLSEKKEIFKNGKAFIHLHENTAEGFYSLPEISEGIFNVNLENLNGYVEGDLRLGLLEGTYTFFGSRKEGILRTVLELKAGNISVPLAGILTYKGKSWNLNFEDTYVERGILTVSFNGLEAEGNFEEIKRLSIGNVELKVFDKTFTKVMFHKEKIDIKKGRFYTEFTVSGSVHGTGVISYTKKNGFLFESNGHIDMDTVSHFIASFVKGRLEGEVKYSILYTKKGLELKIVNNGNINVYSAHLRYPMNAFLEFTGLGKSLAGYLTVWKGERGLSANLGTNDMKNFYVYVLMRELPFIFSGSGIFTDLEITSEAWIDIENLKNITLNASAVFSGDIRIDKKDRKERKKRIREGKRDRNIYLSVEFENEKPVRLLLPEGYAYANVRGFLEGTPEELSYTVVANLVSGELTYFGRTFYIKEGTLTFIKERERDVKRLDITILTPEDGINMFLRIRGTIDDPKVIVWSEPPLSPREIISRLVVGGSAEGFIPVASALFKEFERIGYIRERLSTVAGLRIRFITLTTPYGETGVGINIRKKIAKIFSLEYQQASLKDPRATYYGGNIHILDNLTLSGRTFSDNTSEIRLRFIKKFDF